MAFYHKYRPQSLNDLVGQSQVNEQLLNAFNSQNLSHAYLFVGPRGTGKTSTARILAKMVNCENTDKTSTIPCNQCQTCLSITDGSNLDLIEIDAASNRGIEDIRSLRETVKLSPSSSRKKVYIIDEVHMLSTEAFNALLKTLEEPPSHVLFILATTEAHKIPSTILSRVTRINFELATNHALQAMLSKIIETEKIDIEPEALKLIYQLSEGSFRDATKLLEQVKSDSKVTAESVEKLLRVSSFDNLSTMIGYIKENDLSSALQLVDSLLKDNIPLRDYTISLASIFRQILLLQTNAENLVALDLSSSQIEQLKQIGHNFSRIQIVETLKSLQTCVERIKTTNMPQLALELTLVEICNNTQEKTQISSPSVNQTTQAAPVIEPTPIVTESPSSDSVVSPSFSVLQDKWTYVLETIKPHNFSLEAIMRGVKLANIEKDTVILEAPYTFHQRIIDAPKNRSLIEAVIGEVLQSQVKIQVIIGIRPEKSEDLANVELAADDEIIRVAAEIFNSDPISS